MHIKEAHGATVVALLTWICSRDPESVSKGQDQLGMKFKIFTELSKGFVQPTYERLKTVAAELGLAKATLTNLGEAMKNSSNVMDWCKKCQQVLKRQVLKLAMITKHRWERRKVKI